MAPKAKKKKAKAKAKRKRAARPQKLRVGMIGVGGIAQGHIRRFLDTKKVEIPAISDPAQKSIDRTNGNFPELAEKWAIYDDYRQMLKEVDLDAVCICSLHTQHYEQIMDSLKKDLHVLVEKPMTCTIERAKKVKASAARRKKVVQIAYQRHFMPPYRYVRQQIQSGKHGPVDFISVLQCQNWLPITHTWRGDPKWSGGGQINDSGSHLIDIILWMTGLEPDEVFAYQENCGARVDILSAVSVRFTNKALCNVSIIGKSAVRGMWEDISIWADKCAWMIRKNSVTECREGKERVEVPDSKLPKATNVNANFVGSILGKEEPQTPPICGLRTIQLTQGAWDSARLGKPVKVST